MWPLIRVRPPPKHCHGEAMHVATNSIVTHLPWPWTSALPIAEELYYERVGIYGSATY